MLKKDPFVNFFLIFSLILTHLMYGNNFAKNLTFGPASPSMLFWENISPTPSPPMRFSNTQSFYASINQIIIFGGRSGPTGTYYNDTWSYNPNANTWTELFPSTSPSARNSAIMGYSAITQELMLFGGHNASGNLNDTWIFKFDTTTNTYSWTEVFPNPSPPARNATTMSYDRTIDKFILFGGYNRILNADFDDTWSYDATTNSWTDLNPTTSPPARDSAQMSYDPITNQVVLFGGYDDATNGNLNDTWAYEGTTNLWTNINPLNPPAGRYGAAMVYDLLCQQIILFGGGFIPGGFLNDTWAFNASSNLWTNLNLAIAPGAREFTRMSSYSTTGQIILFAGVDNNNNPQAYDDTWALNLSPNFTSNNTITFIAGTPSTFTISTSGFPIPVITITGVLPNGLTFVDNSNGTATLSGTTTQTGIYNLIFTANNGLTPPVSQNFTLIIELQFTSNNTTTFIPGIPSTFTVSTLGLPFPAISIAGFLPNGITFVNNGNGTGTLSGTTTQVGIYNLIFTASNGISPNVIQVFTLVIGTVLPPIDLKGIQQANKFLTQTEYVNILTWKAPINGSPVIAYQIYRDHYPQNLIAEISAPMAYTDQNRKKNKVYTYYIVSIDKFGNNSAPSIVKVNPKK